MSTPDLLREIADVMEENGMDIEGVWQNRPGDYHAWGEVSHPVDLIDTAMRGWQIRRRPRTIKVSGEIPDELIGEVRHTLNTYHESHPSYRVADVLLDMIKRAGG